MKHLMHGLKIALILVFCMGGVQFTFAQGDGRLEKKVRVYVENERIKEVLKDLEKRGYLTFSYKSGIFNKEKTVTLKIKESTLREALEQILGRNYSYSENDDYVFIFPKGQDLLVVPKPALKARMAKKRMVGPEEPREGRMPSAPKAPRGPDSIKFDRVNQTVRNIINDMIADGIVKDKDSFRWFGLDSGQFVVDGRPMGDSLRVKYATKYIKADGFGYYYGSVQVQGRGYFLDKEEVYGDRKP